MQGRRPAVRAGRSLLVFVSSLRGERRGEAWCPLPPVSRVPAEPSGERLEHFDAVTDPPARPFGRGLDPIKLLGVVWRGRRLGGGELIDHGREPLDTLAQLADLGGLVLLRKASGYRITEHAGAIAR